MKKETGKLLIECYDNYGNKVVSHEDETRYTVALVLAKAWEDKNEGNTAVISRIMYNSVCEHEKWAYTDGLKKEKG